jgi:phosphatidylglycerophosphate synthase
VSLSLDNRRPIDTRNASWARSMAARLAAWGITPNQISVASVAFAALGCWLLLQNSASAWLLAALCVQLRLLCNLFDGMVAVEGGRSTAVGALYNEFPDRVADSLLLIPIGYLAGVHWLGWLCALLAALTAYVRLMGGSLAQAQSFQGPMAKQHRMAVLTLACLLAAACLWMDWGLWAQRVWLLAGVVIAAGSATTCATRTRHIAKQLQ